MSDSPVKNVSDTAYWVAHFRAVETQRAEPLFRDPLAGVLAGERGKAIAEAMPMRFMTEWLMIMRTRVIDDYIEAAVSQGVDTVVNLGAGLDTRPYRLQLPGSLLWVEADYAATIDFKAKALEKETPRCRLERVRIDLADAAARGAMLAGVDARARNLLVLSEGVVPYLSEPEVASVAGDLKSLQHLSGWMLDYVSARMHKSRFRRGVRNKMRNAPVRFLPADWFAFFKEQGWRLKEMYYYVDAGRRLGRAIEWPLWPGLLVKAAGPFLPAKRREEFRRAAGMAVLEPETAAVGEQTPRRT